MKNLFGAFSSLISGSKENSEPNVVKQNDQTCDHAHPLTSGGDVLVASSLSVYLKINACVSLSKVGRGYVEQILRSV